VLLLLLLLLFAVLLLTLYSFVVLARKEKNEKEECGSRVRLVVCRHRGDDEERRGWTWTVRVSSVRDLALSLVRENFDPVHGETSAPTGTCLAVVSYKTWTVITVRHPKDS
jgi:hypothetical protein